MSPGRIALAPLILAAAATSAQAQTVTAYKTGEETTGLTKQCFYDGLGNAYTQTVKSTQLCPLTIRVRVTPNRESGPESPTPTPERPTRTAYLTDESTTGSTKQCYYEALGTTYTRTVSSAALCRLTIQVPR